MAKQRQLPLLHVEAQQCPDDLLHTPDLVGGLARSRSIKLMYL